MAAKRSVWGIDIGQSALKALKCRVSDDGETVVALHGGASPGEGVPEVLGLRVDDVHEVVEAVTAAGGQVVEGPSQPGGEGIWLATCTDTEGNRFFLSAPVEAA